MRAKKIKDMSAEERAEYQRNWYAQKLASKNAPLVITINNCTDELRLAIIDAIRGEENV